MRLIICIINFGVTSLENSLFSHIATVSRILACDKNKLVLVFVEKIPKHLRRVAVIVHRQDQMSFLCFRVIEYIE